MPQTFPRRQNDGYRDESGLCCDGISTAAQRAGRKPDVCTIIYTDARYKDDEFYTTRREFMPVSQERCMPRTKSHLAKQFQPRELDANA